MKHPKPILVIKQKCKGCDGTKEQLGMAGQTEDSMFLTMQICEVCKGVGEQKMKITPLRDFKKCDCTCHNRIIESHRGKHYNYIDCTKCKGTDYIIPKEYEPYEIKKVSEINHENWELYMELKKHNFKEDDKVMVRTR